MLVISSVKTTLVKKNIFIADCSSYFWKYGSVLLPALPCAYMKSPRQGEQL